MRSARVKTLHTPTIRLVAYTSLTAKKKTAAINPDEERGEEGDPAGRHAGK